MTNFKWLLDKVRCVSVRNLISTDGKDLENLPSPVLEFDALSGETDSEKSEQGGLCGLVISETCNPDWYVSDLQRGAAKVDENCSKAMLRVRNSIDGVILLEYALNLDSMKFLGPVFNLELFQKMPFNTLFLITDAGLFVQNETFTALNPYLLSPLAMDRGNAEIDQDNDSPLRSSSAVDTSVLIESMTKLLKEVADDKEEKQKENNKSNKDGQILENKRKALTIAQLVEEVKMAELIAEEEEKAEEEDLAVLRDTADLNAHIERCNALSSQISVARKEQEQLRQEGVKVQFLFEARQIKLISELQTIYPIEKLGSGERYAIRGLELLSVDCPLRDEEQLTTVLGYVVHVIILLSKYRQINLRYQPLYYSSKSMIRDPTQSNPLLQNLPLYRRDVEIDRFKLATLWLTKDIEQILQTKGLTYDWRRNMLFNLHNIFLNEMQPMFS